MFDAVETFEVIEAAEYADASDVWDAELIKRVLTPASSPVRDDELRVAANSFEQCYNSPSRSMMNLYIRYISKQFACQNTVK
jgi:hypothetical protein